jgi:LCP family protein required for cell wall assembly
LSDRDRDPTQDGPAEDDRPEDASGPPPATWAGRQRNPDEEAGDHPQLPAEEAEEWRPAEEQSQGQGPEGAESGDGVPEAEAPESPESDDDHADVAPDSPGDDGAPDPAGDDAAPDSAGDGAAGDEAAERLGEDTVEADTLALGDREAAREAALAGLRARAAEHATKHGTEAVTAPPPPSPPPGEAAAKAEEPPAEAPPAAVPAEEAEGPPSQRSVWARFAVGSLLVIVAMATATALSVLIVLDNVLAEFRGIPGVQNQLAVAHPGDPQTFLILGSDKRPDEAAEFGARSDTAILLRIASDQITVMSIPRDLKVNIPGHGPDRFNAAYTYGGPQLTLKVVKQLTGITDINHVVNVDFTGFADAVNSIGCVYVDVDHHYYHSNLGLAAADQYAEIDIPAGYQRMCGYNALQYVRFRHDDNDLVRSARQQEFLRETRQELPADRIANQYEELVDILHKYVTLEIQDGVDLINLAKLIVSAGGAPVVQVNFPANLGGPNASYVTASDSAIRSAVAKFQGAVSTPAEEEPSDDSGGGKSGSGDGGGSGGGGGEPEPPPLIDSTTTGQQVAAMLASTKAKDGKPMVNFPVYYPTLLAPGSTILTDQSGIEESRAFPIDGPGDEVYHGYKIVVSIPTDAYTGYYGLSGTDWKEPPILEHPDETREIDGQEYLLSWDGPALRLIGWKTDDGSYWVDNTLVNVLTPGQMFGIAQSMQQYTG